MATAFISSAKPSGLLWLRIACGEKKHQHCTACRLHILSVSIVVVFVIVEAHRTVLSTKTIVLAVLGYVEPAVVHDHRESTIKCTHSGQVGVCA